MKGIAEDHHVQISSPISISKINHSSFMFNELPLYAIYIVQAFFSKTHNTTFFHQIS